MTFYGWLKATPLPDPLGDILLVIGGLVLFFWVGVFAFAVIDMAWHFLKERIGATAGTSLQVVRADAHGASNPSLPPSARTTTQLFDWNSEGIA